MSEAYEAGRMGADPANFWYEGKWPLMQTMFCCVVHGSWYSHTVVSAGEIGFFDNYIIPLAKKLKDCNVFGVSSDECLSK